MNSIRPSREEDLPALTAIYGHQVLHGTGTFEILPPSQAEMGARRADVLAKRLPHLVLEDAGQVAGFAYCQWFKPRPAYRYCAEDSIYLHPAAHGRGLGRLLLATLVEHAQLAGLRKLIAVIGDSDNAASIGLHQALGFERIGVVPSCGWKFNRWLDIVLMEKPIGEADRTAPQAPGA